MADIRKPGGNASKGTGSMSTGSASYSHADFTYVRKKRRQLVEEEETGELNIVPYLDILVNLIMFLLVTQATLVSLGLVDVTAPSYAPPGGGADAPPKVEEQLRLTIGIAQEGFFIAAKGGVLPGDVQGTGQVTPDGVERHEPTVPKRPDGSYDFPTLTAKLRSIKTAFPKANAVFVAADDTISYETLVKTLDASREDARGPLFPSVAFTQIQ